MRNIDECKAEVLRCMENGIKEQWKIRKRTIAICVPLCLCIMVFAVILLTNIITGAAESKDSSMADIAAAKHIEGTHGQIFTLVKIKRSPEHYYLEYNAEKVNVLFNTVQSIFHKNTDSSKKNYIFFGSAAKGAEFENSSSSTDKTGVVYTITFSTVSGEKVIYELNGNELVNQTTGDKIILTDDRRTEFVRKIDLFTEVKVNNE